MKQLLMLALLLSMSFGAQAKWLCSNADGSLVIESETELNGDAYISSGTKVIKYHGVKRTAETTFELAEKFPRTVYEVYWVGVKFSDGVLDDLFVCKDGY